jgi:peptidoglycan/xylan/chitin deacetylase (PgdA/CDA1 family)
MGMITNQNYKLFLLINGKNYHINNLKKLILTFSFSLLIINIFIQISYSEKDIILNFDDDWKAQLTYAMPILEKYRFNASFFVTTGCLIYQNSSFCNNTGGD